ncbi:MAG: carbohydrate-binding protein [Verrucomicrobiota bacterium]|nr:carbohydrate-binding protein [Verrucomicrobiota bacterium]
MMNSCTPKTYFTLRYTALTISLLISKVSILSGQTPANYTNPNNSLVGADPHVLDNRARDGYYYIYYTDGLNTTRYRSTNLVNWSSKGTAYTGSHAPHAIYWPADGKYYLFGNYFRASATSANSTFTTIDNRMGFDQMWFTDVDGQNYCIVGGNAPNPSAIYRMSSPTASPATWVRQHYLPQTTWGATFEGAWLHRLADGTYILMVSNAAANGSSYSLAYATGPTAEGPFELVTWSAASCFLRTSTLEGIYGPGHHCMLADDQGNQWVFYQQKDGSASAWDRKVALDPIWFDVSGVPQMRPTRATSMPGPGSTLATLWPSVAASTIIQAESHDGSAVVQLANGGTGKILENALPRAYAAYRRIDFGSGNYRGFSASVSCAQAFTSALEVRLGGVQGPVIARLPISNTGSITTFATNSTPLMENPTGIQDIVLVFTGPIPLATTGNLDWFTFTTATAAGTINHPPVAQKDRISLVGGTFAALHVLDNDSDPDGDTLNMRGRAYVSTTELVNKSLRYYVPGTLLGEVQFPYSIDDGHDGYATTEAILKVAPSPGAYMETNGLAVFEAEDFHARIPTTDTSRWSEETALADYEGRGYVTTADSGTTAATQTGDQLDYAVDIQTPGLYTVWARVASGTGGNNSNLSEIGVGVGLFDFSFDDLAGTSSQSWHWVKLSAIQSLRAGLHRISLLRREDGQRIDRFVLTTDANYDPAAIRGGLGPIASAPGVETARLPVASLNNPYRTQLVAKSGRPPYTWSISSSSELPTGLSLSTAGVLSGTATGSSGLATFEVQVMDITGAINKHTMQLTISDTAPAPVSIESTSLSDATLGASYGEILIASGGCGSAVWTLESGSLPNGLRLEQDGWIRGVPTVSGTFNFTAQASFANSASTRAMSINVVATGRILREVWRNITGSTIPDLTGNARFSGTADAMELIPVLQPQLDQDNNYGARLRGWVHPATSGAYTFTVNSDDQSEIWLSTNDTAASKQKIIAAGTFGTSSSINLTAGQRYYLEILYKEGRFGDNLTLSWQPPGSTTTSVIDGAFLSPFALPPPAPSRLNAYSTSTTGVQLIWGDNSPNETSFEVQYKLATDSSWSLLSTEQGDVNTKTVSNLDSGKNYQFRVRAVNATGSSNWSAAASATTQIDVTVSYSNWLSGFNWQGTDQSMTVDADGDGIQNLVEYAFGLNPVVADKLSEQLVLGVSVSQIPQITFDLDNRKTEVTVTVQSSTDLQNWETCQTYTPDGTTIKSRIVCPANHTVSEVQSVYMRLKVLSVP